MFNRSCDLEHMSFQLKQYKRIYKEMKEGGKQEKDKRLREGGKREE
jgi:hypothetical protein